jgi:tetratricopeptide (TPR) repeat protein
MTRLKFYFLCFATLLAMPCSWSIADDSGGEAERIKLLERAALESPGNPAAQGELAEAYYKIYQTSRDPADAELSMAQYRKFLSLQPAHDGAKLVLYSLLYEKMLGGSSHRELLGELRKMYDGIPEHIRTSVMPPSTMEAVTLLVPSGEPGATIDRGKIELLLKNGIRESPRFGNTYFILGVFYRDIKNYDSEIAVLKQAAFMMPDDPEVRKNLSKSIGNKLERMECYTTEPSVLDEAIQSMQQALGYAPDDVTVHKGLLRMYEMKGLYDMQLFQARALYKLTGSAADNEFIANAHVNIGSLQEAIGVYEAIREKGSTRSSLKRRLGIAYFYQQNLEESAKLLAAYTRENSRDLYSRISYLTVEDALGNRQKGRDSLRAFMDDRANKFNDWTQALAYYLLGVKSEQELRDIAHNPCRQTEAYYYLGMDHLHEGDVVLAKDYFNKVIELKVYGFEEYMGASYALKSMESEAGKNGKRRKKK